MVEVEKILDIMLYSAKLDSMNRLSSKGLI
jgi:hypothetical protein